MSGDASLRLPSPFFRRMAPTHDTRLDPRPRAARVVVFRPENSVTWQLSTMSFMTAQPATRLL